MLVFGGEAPAGTFNQVEAYDAKSNSWGMLSCLLWGFQQIRLQTLVSYSRDRIVT